jgi:predicted  nucleic acid-binding Zn-ribbon protein
MKHTIPHLLQLAQIDQELETIDEQRANIPQEMKDLKLAIDQHEKEIQKAQVVAEKARESHEANQQGILEKSAWISEREQNMQQLKSHKEYQAALKEIAVAKKEILDREAAMDVLLKETQNTLQTYEALNEKNRLAMERLASKIQTLQDEFDSMNPQIERLLAERELKLQNLPAKLAQTYESIRKKATPALSLATQFYCSECGSKIPPQLFNQLHVGQELLVCPRCKRILYLEQHTAG